ncbi:MAG: hypothetical protein ACYCPW_02610 [Nitrososphaerales archaeon]
MKVGDGKLAVKWSISHSGMVEIIHIERTPHDNLGNLLIRGAGAGARWPGLSTLFQPLLIRAWRRDLLGYETNAKR